jgi:hypothetical protein
MPVPASVGRIALAGARASRRRGAVLLARIDEAVNAWVRTILAAPTGDLPTALRLGYEAFVAETSRPLFPVLYDVALQAARQIGRAFPGVDPEAIAAAILKSRAGYAVVSDMADRVAGAWQKVRGEDTWRFDPYAVERQSRVFLAAAERSDLTALTVQRDLAQLVQGNDIDYSRYGLTRSDMTALRTTEYRARRVAVTETLDVAREATATALGDGGIAAATWTLSPTHTGQDDCDDLAEADTDLGTGMYALDAWPDGPHPFCACMPGPPFLGPGEG